MRGSINGTNDGQTFEIIAFQLHDQDFCVRTTSIREIRGWGQATPLPHAPADVLGVMNLRGTVIPIIDLARKLGMESVEPTERSAIVVADVHGMAIGLVVDRVSDIFTVPVGGVQPVPEIGLRGGATYSDGIIVQPSGMICFLNLENLFVEVETARMVVAA